MKKKYLLILIAISFNFSFSQILFEDDFDGSGPGLAGWTVIDNDGNTINTAIPFITDAWVAIDKEGTDGNFGGPAGDFSAMSGSWYTAVATSDDWMITPAINIIENVELTWDAKAQDADFPDSYEVRISTTGTNIATDFGTVLFSVNPESAVWASHTVDLTSYNTETVYIAWINNSTDKFVLLVDNVSLAVNNLSTENFNDPTAYQISCNGKWVTISNIQGKANYRVLSITGKIAIENKTNLESQTVDLTSLASGIYIVEVSNAENNRVQRKKVVIQ